MQSSSAAQAGESAKVDIRRDIELLNSSAVVSLLSALEVGIEDFLIAWMMNQPGALKVPALRKTKITLAGYDALDREERMHVLLAELERNVIGKQGVDCIPLAGTGKARSRIEAAPQRAT